MKPFESEAARILAAVSELLQKPLYLVDSQAAEARSSYAVRLGALRSAVVSADKSAFDETEKRLIEELFHVFRMTKGHQQDKEGQRKHAPPR